MRIMARFVGAWKTESEFERVGYGVVGEPRVPGDPKRVSKSRLQAGACDPFTLYDIDIAVLLRCNEYGPREL